MDIINDIRLLVKKGYSNEEIKETLDVSDEDINNVRISYMHVDIPTKNRFSTTCINVFCKFLERGISNEQLYELFRLRKKCKKEEFNVLCQNLREGKIYTDITSQYNLPMEPTVTLDLDKYKKDKPKKSQNNISKDINKDLYKERREITRRQREKQKALVAESIARKEKEDMERAEKVRKAAEAKRLAEEDAKNKIEPAEPIVYKEEIITDIYKDEPLPVLDTTPTSVNSDDKIHRVCALLNKGYPYGEIQELTSVPISTISRIHNGESYTDISAKYGIVSKKSNEKMLSILKCIEN